VRQLFVGLNFISPSLGVVRNPLTLILLFYYLFGTVVVDIILQARVTIVTTVLLALCYTWYPLLLVLIREFLKSLLHSHPKAALVMICTAIFFPVSEIA